MERMLRALSHRGPSSFITHISTAAAPDILLAGVTAKNSSSTFNGTRPPAHAAPNMPLSVDHIAWDAEIYNSSHLRETLAQEGWPSGNAADSEFLLQAYRAWGSGCVQRFQGVFAICLVDPERGHVWFCRDRLGVKPLYLTRPQGGGLLFASELRTLLAAGPDLVPPIVSPSGMESLLSHGAVFGMDSIVENVRLLAPGESLVTDFCGRLIASKSYWRIPFVPAAASPYLPNPSSRARAGQLLSESLRYAVQLSFAGQQPVGMLLSGGFQSAVVAAIAADISKQPLHTLHVAFNGTGGNGSRVAADTAAELGADHQTITISLEEILGSLPQALAAADQPNASGFFNYHMARAARRAGFAAAVTAVGGDGFALEGLHSSRVRRALRFRNITHYLGPTKYLVARLVDALARRNRGMCAELLRRDPTVAAIYLLGRELFRPDERRNFFEKPRNSDALSGLSHDVMLDMTLNCSGMDMMNQIAYIELVTSVRNMSLRDADVFGAAHGIDVRLPMLDYLVVEQLAAMPGFLKSPHSYARSILAEAAGTRFDPSAHSWSERTPVLPWNEWLRGPLRNRVQRAMEDRDLWSQLGCAPDAAANLWRRFLAGDRRVTEKQIVTLMVLEDFAKRHGLRAGRKHGNAIIQANSVAG
jgi:asparagine synthase (glutamine-hydrolysing)